MLLVATDAAPRADSDDRPINREAPIGPTKNQMGLIADTTTTAIVIQECIDAQLENANVHGLSSDEGHEQNS